MLRSRWLCRGLVAAYRRLRCLQSLRTKGFGPLHGETDSCQAELSWKTYFLLFEDHPMLMDGVATVGAAAGGAGAACWCCRRCCHCCCADAVVGAAGAGSFLAKAAVAVAIMPVVVVVVLVEGSKY